ncbi:hypothetical protein GCM10022246_16840 [Pedobacter ginsengiterrae]|uniref:Uncharacterized protein n=2 Tax=Sphingobacteriaceae TaxID=84566 RepID=A0ABP7PFT4_9SPHI
MLPKFKTLYFFENTDIIIMEIQRMDLADHADASELYHWLFLDKLSDSLVKLWFRSMDTSTEIQERYFEQGYLKFNSLDATYIEKYNSAQHKLTNFSERPLLPELEIVIENYLKKP